MSRDATGDVIMIKGDMAWLSVAWLSVDVTNIMLTVSQEDINFETNFMIDKPLRIGQILYVFAN